jgi:cold shock CspA family protein
MARCEDDDATRIAYFDRWNSIVGRAFVSPPKEPQPDTLLGRRNGEVTEYEEGRGVGFIRADDGGPTFFFRWSEITGDAHFKTITTGAHVDFEARLSGAGERFALDVVPVR